MPRDRRSRRQPRRISALLAIGLLAAALTALPQTAPQAEAALPAQCGPPVAAGIACVQIYAGDYRSGATSIAPLAGARFGLFVQNPEASIDAFDGFVHPDVAAAAGNPALFICTSDPQGDCVFTVPIRPGATDSTGVPQTTRLWTAPLSPLDASFEYFANPFWQTGPLTPSATATLEVRHVFQTPPLYGQGPGRTGLYLAGQQWITDPGLQTNPTNNGMTGTVSEFQRRIASGGVWPMSRFNLDMPTQCGLNVAFIVDVSSSVASPQDFRVGLVNAMNVFVDALRGTPSQVALFTFGTDSPGNDPSGTRNFANTGLLPVGTQTEATTFKNRYANWPTGSWPTNYTNWDRGLAAAAAVNADLLDPTQFDLAVFLTDGNPTVYGPGATGASPSGFTRFREIGNGVASSNLLKLQGTRVLSVGVGAGVSFPGAEFNLRSVSGRDEYTGGNILEADYLIADDYAEAGAALRNLVLSSCAPSVSVIKRILPFGSVDPAQATIPSSQWQFTPSNLTAGTVTPNPGLTDLQTGGVAFDLSFTVDEGAVGLTISETDQPGFTPVPDLIRCRNITADGPEFVPAHDEDTNTFDVTGIGLQDAISCVVYNQGPPDVVDASVQVHKQWDVEGVVYQNGTQPDGLSAQLLLSGPQSITLSNQPWSQVRSGYNVGAGASPASANVTIAENIAVGQQFPGIDCSLAERRIRPGPVNLTDTGATAPATGNLLTGAPLAAGTNEWTVTNVVDCTTTLTLMKSVANGPLVGSPQFWQLDATPSPADGALAGPTGPSGATAEVTPRTVYQLVESIPSPAPDDRMFHYVQTDIRDPLLRDFPGASGSWNCHPVAGLRGNDISIGGSGAVVVPPGEHYECTAVNATSLLTVDKTVLPEGAAEPGSFEFELTAIPPIVVDDPNELRFPAGQEQTVVPNQQYSLAEIAQPDFQLTQLECVSDAGDAVPIADLVLAPGDTATCAAVNQLGSWTAVKSSDPPSGTSVAPGDVIRYTVTAIQLFEGGVSTDVVITDDLVDVLDDATVVEGSVSATSGTVEQVGDTRVWTIPSLTGTEELTFEVRVNDDAWDATLDNVVTIAGDGGVDCADASFEEDCDETHHTTPDPPPTPTPTPTPPVPSLPATGANSPDALLLSALAALLIGAALLRVSRRERARRSRAQT